LSTHEILANNIESISKYIRALSYAGHGCLSLYWEICKKKSINARYFIDYFPVGSRAFRAKHRLFPSQENYKENRWRLIRKILLKLKDSGFIIIEPMRDSPPLRLQPAKLFVNADYSLTSLVSAVAFAFPRPDGERHIKEVTDAHKFIHMFVPRHIPPRYYPKSALKKSFLKKIKRARGTVVIHFPIL